MKKVKKYDLIFSIGQACSCTGALRRAGLQLRSYPFDWLFGADFAGRVGILLNDFERFINKEDLEYFYSEKSISCDAYKNNFNGLVFNHDFLSSIEFDAMYRQVLEKYNRRISRLQTQIVNSAKILLVYVEQPFVGQPQTADETLESSLRQLRAKYPNKSIDLLYFYNDFNFKPLEFQKERTHEGVVKVVGNYKDMARMGQGEEHEVDLQFFDEQLKGIRLSVPLSYKTKRFLQKFAAKLVPFRALRRRLKKAWKI